MWRQSIRGRQSSGETNPLSFSLSDFQTRQTRGVGKLQAGDLHLDNLQSRPTEERRERSLQSQISSLYRVSSEGLLN